MSDRKPLESAEALAQDLLSRFPDEELFATLIEADRLEVVRRVLEVCALKLAAPAWLRSDEHRPRTWHKAYLQGVDAVKALDPAAVLRELTDGE